MRLIKLAWLPFLLLLVLSSRLLSFGGVATLREDTPAMIHAIVATIDAAWAWLSSPPLWVTCLALAIMTCAYIGQLLGAERLIRLSRHLFRRDARIADYKLISDDTDLNRLHFSSGAFEIARRVDWKIPPFSEPRARTGDVGDDLHNFEALLAYKTRLRMFLNAIDAAAKIELSSIIQDLARGKAEDIGARWSVTSDAFAADARRIEFNEAYAFHKGLELALGEVQGALRGVAGDWFPAPLNSANNFKVKLLEKILERLPQ